MLDETETAITIPGYSIENEVGKGGMATVYLAIQESLRRRVALKVMAPALTSDKNFAERFLKEGQIVAQLDHPQIVTVFDFGTYHHLYYLSMEYLPGSTLEQKIREGLSNEHAVQIIKTIAEALGYAHSQGVLHRDIKPHNILFRRDGRPVLTDFGIARFIDDNVHLTAPGLTVGSPSYMSPERVSGKNIDARSDLYSMGVVFYQMLTGELPYQADSPISVAIKHCSEPLPTLPTACGKFQSILDKLLAKEPDNRFPNAEAFVTALNDFETQQHTIKLSQPLPTTPLKKPFISYQRGLLIGGLMLILSAGGYFAINDPFSSNQLSSFIDLQALPAAAEDRSPIAGRYEELAIETLEEGNLAESLALIDFGLGSVSEDSRLVALRGRIVNLETAKTRLQEAQQLQQQGDLQQSLAKIQEGLELAPNYPELMTLQETVVSLQTAKTRLQEAQQLQQQGDLQQSLAKIQEGLEAAPDNSALLELGEKIQTQLTNQKKAADFLQQAQQQFQDRAYEESLNSVEKGLQLVLDDPELLALRDEVKAQINQEQEVDRLIGQAQELEQKGSLVEALVLLDGGQQRLPDHPKILALRDKIGSALARQKETNALLQQAQKQYQDGKLQESLATIEQGLKLLPQQADLLALQEDVQNQWQQQQAELAETEHRQQEAERLLKQAKEFFQEGELQESLATIEQGLKLLPQQADLLALQEDVQNQWQQQQAELAETERRQQEAKRLLKQAKELFQEGELEQTQLSIDEGLKQVPDHPDLRALQDKVQTALARRQEADELLQQAKQTWQNGDSTKSLALTKEGLLLVPKQPDLLLLQEQIEQQISEQNEIAEALKECQSYPEFDSLSAEQVARAVACYQTVLHRQPDNSQAHQAMQSLADQYVALTEQAIASGAENQAEGLLAQLEQLDSAHSALNPLKERLSTLIEESQQAASETRLAELLEECAAHLSANRLTTGQGGTALNCYNQVLAEDPDNTEAQTGLEQIATRYVDWAATALSGQDDAQAQRHLQRLAQVNPQHPRLATLRSELQTLQTLQQNRQRQAEQAELNRQRQAEQAEQQNQLRQAAVQQQRERINSLLSQAQRRYANGAFEESLTLVDQGLELAPEHNRLQTLRQEIQAKLAEVAAPEEPSSPTRSDDEEDTRPRKRIFGTF